MMWKSFVPAAVVMGLVVCAGTTAAEAAVVRTAGVRTVVRAPAPVVVRSHAHVHTHGHVRVHGHAHVHGHVHARSVVRY